MQRSGSLLEVEDLHVTVDAAGEPREPVRGVSFHVAPGEVFGIAGESGSGKSLTVSAIAGLLPQGVGCSRGSVRFKGEDLRAASPRRMSAILGHEIAMVFQDSLTSLNPIMRVGQQVGEPLLLHHLLERGAAEKAAEQGLRSVGIADPGRAARRYPHEFSGGMRQRAMIATALIASPSLIIADEPTTALDVTVQAQILDICRRLVVERGVALIVISHDLGVMSEFATTLAVMYAGRIVEMGPARKLLTEPEHPYTAALLGSIPSWESGEPYLRAIGGEPPSPGELPNGCPFHPRCRYAEDRCKREEPALLSVQASQSACWVAQRGPLPSSRFDLVVRAQPSPSRSVQADQHEPLLRVERLVKRYPVPSGIPFRKGGAVHALDDVSLVVRAGETLGIVGESGCGKSTLGRCVLRLTEVDSGAIYFKGRDITRLKGEELRRLRREMQPIFQDPYASLNPSARVKDSVAEPLLAHGMPKLEARRRVDETLELVGLGSGYKDRFPHQLSGGQRQRVGIARALTLGTELLVADEPISSLDVSIQAQILNLLKDLQRRLNLTLMFISHDLRLVRHMSTNIAIIHLGKIVEFGPSDELTSRPRHPYTAALLSAIPEVGRVGSGGRIILKGDVPSPVNPPAGCRFHTRCWLREQLRNPEECVTIDPVLRAVETGHEVACHFAETVEGSSQQFQVTAPAPVAATGASLPNGAATQTTSTNPLGAQ